MWRTTSPNLPAGEAKAIGFVPNIGTLERVGATSGEELVIDIPIMPASAARIAYQPAIPQWLDPPSVESSAGAGVE